MEPPPKAGASGGAEPVEKKPNLETVQSARQSYAVHKGKLKGRFVPKPAEEPRRHSQFDSNAPLDTDTTSNAMHSAALSEAASVSASASGSGSVEVEVAEEGVAPAAETGRKQGGWGWQSTRVQSFIALTKKNAKLKKTNWCGSCCELMLPLLFIMFMNALHGKSSVEPPWLPEVDVGVPSLAFLLNQTDTASGNVLCYDNNPLIRCACYEPLPTTTTNGGVKNYYDGGSMNYPVQAYFALAHSDSAYIGICQAIIGAATTSSAAASGTTCESLQLAITFCPGVIAKYFSDAVSAYDSACDFDNTFIEEEVVIQSVINQAIAFADSVGAGWTLTGTNLEATCQTLHLAIAPVLADCGGDSSCAAATAFASYVTARYPTISDNLVYYETEDDIVADIKSSEYSQNGLIPMVENAIIFDGGNATSPLWEYTIRTNFSHTWTSKLDGYFTYAVPSTRRDTDTSVKSASSSIKEGTGSAPPFATGYFVSSVLTLQQTLDQFIVYTTSGGAVDGTPNYWVSPFPNGKYDSSTFWQDIGNMFATFLIIVLIFPVNQVIKALVIEKELKIKEGMLQMGLEEGVYMFSWMYWFSTIFFMLAAVLTVFGKAAIFENSDPSLVFSWFFFFLESTLALCFLIGTFYSTARSAATFGSMMFFLTLFPYYAITESTSQAIVIVTCLVPTACFAIGTLPFAEFEDSGQGITINTLFDSAQYQISFGQVLIMLLVDIALYSFLAWYASQVVRNDWGTSLPWNFLFTKAYWRPSKAAERDIDSIRDLVMNDEGSRGDKSVEPVSAQLRRQLEDLRCVIIRDLKKTFIGEGGLTVEAVKQLNITMYKGQITALLGHNGAGKTTTMNMLCGMLPVTSGHALVNGLDVKTQMKAIRQTLGVCPQHDILFDDLTVRFHLSMYAIFKGVPKKEVDDEVNNMLRAVGLTEKADELTYSLSGGQKRKLSVGIAFIGGSSVVFLDEPTSGMDPFSRRFTWNVIRKQKEGRVIILTTHFMDEADLLGDRIAIMAHGELKCLGSSLFLKTNYGVGYNLTIAKNVQGTKKKVAALGEVGDEAAVERKQRRAIHDLVCRHVRRAKVLSDVGAEMSFQLPSKASSSFKPLLLDLDNHLKEYGITSYGMGVTTLEEVFLRVARGTAEKEDRRILRRLSSLRMGSNVSLDEGDERGGDEKAGDAFPSNNEESVSLGHRRNSGGGSVGSLGSLGEERRASLEKDKRELGRLQELGTPEIVTDAQRFRRHVYALLVKRVHNFKRDKKIIGFSLFAPAFFILAGLLILLAGTTLDEPLLVLSMTGYNTGISIAEQNPLYYPNGVCAVNDGQSTSSAPCDSSVFITALPTDVGLQMKPTDEVEPSFAINNMSQVLLETRSGSEASKASRYGAFAWHELDATANVYDVTAMCNYTALHSAPTYLNMAGSASLRLATGGDESTTNIEVSMHPLPATQLLKGLYASASTFPTVIFILIGYAFIPAAWAGVVVKEREGKMKHQQVVSGVSLVSYWISAYVWDLVIYYATPVLCFIFLAIFGGQGLTSNGGWGPLAVLLVVFGPAAAGFTYITSFNFTTYASAMSSTLFINWVTGLLFSLAALFMVFTKSTQSVAKVIKWIFRVFPLFCVGDGLFNLAFRDVLAYTYGKTSLSPWSMEITGANVIYLVVEGVVYLLVTLWLEKASAGTATLGSYRKDKRLRERLRAENEAELWDADTLQTDGTSYEDEDVVNERLRVQEMSRLLGRTPEEVGAPEHVSTAAVMDEPEADHAEQALIANRGEGDVISIEGLRKVYLSQGAGLKVAVRNQWLGIAKGEVFGLLGINGAGKTTTMAMLCGEQTPTKGRAFLAGMDIASNPEDVHRMVGYCPQFDALFDTMSGREHLELYARIKCIPEENIAELIEGRIAQMGLERYADKLAGSYSGGNKRKLSVAIALLGRPELIMLDEPSTGVDPMARRGMWEVINRVITHNKEAALILTTHSMEECEALCQRMGIMVGGRLRCLGSTQHLKSRFGQGYQLEMTVLHPTDEQVADAGRKLLLHSGLMPSSAFLDAAAVTVDLNQKLNSAQVMAAMGAYSVIKHEISAGGFGADFYEQLLDGGLVVLRDLATWCVTEMALEAVQDFILDGELVGCSLLEKHGGRVRFLIPPQPVMSLGSIFGLLESSHEELRVEEYALGQTSLEQIFNSFAALQDEETAPAPGMVAGTGTPPQQQQQAAGPPGVGALKREMSRQINRSTDGLPRLPSKRLSVKWGSSARRGSRESRGSSKHLTPRSMGSVRSDSKRMGMVPRGSMNRLGEEREISRGLSGWIAVSGNEDSKYSLGSKQGSKYGLVEEEHEDEQLSPSAHDSPFPLPPPQSQAPSPFPPLVP